MNAIILELISDDLEATVDFYTKVLHFKVLEREEKDERLVWALLELQNFKISLKEERTAKEEVPYLKNRSIGGTISLCFQVDDLEGYYEKVKTQCKLLDHPHLTPCGSHQFSMLDNNGYVLTFERF